MDNETSKKIVENMNSLANSIKPLSEKLGNFKKVLENNYPIILKNYITKLFPYANVEVKIINGIVKIISDKELHDINLVTMQYLIGMCILNYTKYQTCVIYNLGLKKEDELEKMYFIASTKFPPFDLCLKSSCDNCVFSSYHTGYDPRIRRWYE